MCDPKKVFPTLHHLEVAVGAVHIAHELAGLRIGDVGQFEPRSSLQPFARNAGAGIIGGQCQIEITGKLLQEVPE